MHEVKIKYALGTMEIFFLDQDLVNPAFTVSVDLLDTLDLDMGRAWVGFTGATGGEPTNHDILNWQYDMLVDTDTVVAIDEVQEVEGDSGQTGTFDFPVTVTRFGDASAPATLEVGYVTADGTATAGSDYTTTSGTVVFDPEVTTKTIIVPTIDDILPEEDETFLVNLSNPSGGATITDSQGVATILDNDGPLFSDSFENGQWNGLWVEDSQNDWFTSTQRETDGSYSAEVDGRATDATLTIASPIDLTPYGSAEVTFDWYIESGFDSGEYLALDLFNGTTWQEVARLSGNVDQENTWHQETVDIGGNYLVSDFQLRFRAKMNKSNEDANVDNVQLIATSLANQPPTAGDDSASTNEDASVPITKADLLLNDADPENNTLSITGFGEPGNGTLVDNGATITYTPNTDFNGTDTFTYTITDGNGGTDTATVDVTITGVADPPVADAGGPYTVVEGAVVTLDASGTTDPDLPYDDVLTYEWDFDNDGVFDDANGVAPTFDNERGARSDRVGPIAVGSH